MSPDLRKELTEGLLALGTTIAAYEDALPTARAELRRRAREQLQDLMGRVSGRPGGRR